MDLVEVKNLTYSYPGRKTSTLSGINFDVNPGEFVLLLGESGSGKSTLCKALNGLVPHYFGGTIGGSVRIRGMITTDSSVSKLSRHVGMVFQDPENQIVTDRIESEVAFGLENTGVPAKQMKKRVQEVLATLRLSTYKNKKLSELSGGQKQKVALASVLVMHPDLIVLDEPTSQLDPISSEDFLATLKSLNDDLGLAVLLTEHRIEKCFHFADRVLVLDRGKLVFDGKPKELAGWSGGSGRIPLPPISELFLDNGSGEIPITVKEGRGKISALMNGKAGIETGNIRATAQSKDRRRPFLKRMPGSSNENGPAVLDVKNVYFSYNDGTQALCGINLTIRPGESVAVIGENGSGKSTLVRHFNGLLRPQRGAVLLEGKNISGREVAVLAKTCGMLGQNPNFQLISKTVEGELEETLNGVGIEIEMHGRLIDKTLRDFSLDEIRHDNPQDLSCGQRERLALASVVVYQPPLLVLDEPTRGIDKRTKQFIYGYLREYRKNGNTVILVTHDLEFAAGCCDRFVLMSDGLVLADGDGNEVLSGSLFFTTQFNKSFRGIVNGVVTLEDARRAMEALK
ncbi:MAG: energy-coupling factor ABC transporter ATP-binding protein [Actinobacteria bacterium]|nr:energy-coupling factor ABC transporter ATP-binding protein [Actinomycetota bacterium]